MNIFIIPIIITLVYTIISAISDLKYGQISNKISLSLTCFGLLISLIYTLYFKSIFFIYTSVVSLIVIFSVSYLLWIIGLWAGGDVKLLCGISSAIPINYLKSPVFSQNYFFIPFTFDVIINSILISFLPIIFYILFIKFRNIKKANLKNKIKYEILFFNLIRSTNSFSTYIKEINQLKEGMILDRIIFTNKDQFIEIKNIIENKKDSNLSCKIKEDKLYIRCKSSAGITNNDIQSLRELYNKKIIDKRVFIKISIIFGPFICIGYVLGLFYGNIILIFI
ncbi:MAG: prepilin peptidase [Methanobrevibacter sp.]